MRGGGAGAFIVPGGIAKGAGAGAGGQTLFTVEGGGCATGADNGLGVVP